MINLDYSITQQAFADLVGVSQPTVSGLITSGVLAEKGTAAEWLLQYCERLRGQAAGRMSSGDYDVSAERARLAHHRANIAQLDQRRRQGELCETASVILTITTIGANFRNALERLADKVADRVAAETDAHECHVIIAAEIQQALEEMANDCERVGHELSAGSDDPAA